MLSIFVNNGKDNTQYNKLRFHILTVCVYYKIIIVW